MSATGHKQPFRTSVDECLLLGAKRLFGSKLSGGPGMYVYFHRMRTFDQLEIREIERQLPAKSGRRFAIRYSVFPASTSQSLFFVEFRQEARENLCIPSIRCLFVELAHHH